MSTPLINSNLLVWSYNIGQGPEVQYFHITITIFCYAAGPCCQIGYDYVDDKISVKISLRKSSVHNPWVGFDFGSSKGWERLGFDGVIIEQD